MLRNTNGMLRNQNTLVFQIIVQVGVKVQVSKISNINKSAGWNKAMQSGILKILLQQIMFSRKNL